MTGPPNENARGGTRARDRKAKSTDTRIIPLIRPQPNRPGILSYRRRRTPGEICAAITNALDREARLARLTGMNLAPRVIEDISAWIGRGCLP